MRLIDLTGQRFEKLVVLSRSEDIISAGQKKVAWLCQCDCGNTTVVQSGCLRGGDTKSCGCLRYELQNDWTGVRQGSLVVQERAPSKPRKSGLVPVKWLCKCDCGGQKILTSNALRDGSSSCGCEYKREKHGHTVKQEASSTYTSWHSMMQRCGNENSAQYPGYGGEGIVVDEPWKNFSKFLEDMGERPEGTSLNRINGAKIYSKDTCEWATLSVQSYDQKRRNTNTSGRTGVSWNKLTEKWEAYIDVKPNRIRLRLHERFEDAVKVREEAELKYFGFNKE